MWNEAGMVDRAKTSSGKPDDAKVSRPVWGEG